MPVRRVLCHEKVEDNRGKVAIQRGPIVYCVEWPDVKDGHVLNLLLPDDQPLVAEFREDLLGGVTAVRGEALGLAWEKPGGPVRNCCPAPIRPAASSHASRAARTITSTSIQAEPIRSIGGACSK